MVAESHCCGTLIFPGGIVIPRYQLAEVYLIVFLVENIAQLIGTCESAYSEHASTSVRIGAFEIELHRGRFSNFYRGHPTI